MDILGISAFYHDSAACLVRDGDIIAAAQEERFTRKKHDHSFPTHAIDYCLKEGGIAGGNIDLTVPSASSVPPAGASVSPASSAGSAAPTGSSASSASAGSVEEGLTVLPETGGAPLPALGVGLLMVAGGLCARRMVRR